MFSGQVAVVTGASSGIGWELARQLAGEGARVGLIARRVGKLQALAEQIEAGGGSAVAMPADVSDRGQVEAAIAELRRALGPIDILIANAGVGMPTLLDPVNIADVEAMIRINVLGVVYTLSAVLPEMLERRSGRLAAVSSLAAYVALPGESGYCASKAAVNVYLKGLRAQVRGRGVSVTTLCPGFVKTPMTAANTFPMPGLLAAEEASRRMLRAIHRRKPVYDFPWSVRQLIRLVSLLPDGLTARLMTDYNEQAAHAGPPA